MFTINKLKELQVKQCSFDCFIAWPEIPRDHLENHNQSLLCEVYGDKNVQIICNHFVPPLL